MAVRLAVVFLTALILGCGGGGGGGEEILPSSQWARGRADNLNSGVGSGTVVNAGGGQISRQLSGGAIRSTPAIGVDGNVFVATTSGGIYAFDPELEPLWDFLPVESPSQPGCNAVVGATRASVAVDPFDIVYFGTEMGYVVAVEGGEALWCSKLSANPINGSPILILDTVDNNTQALIVADSSGTVFALGGGDGQIRWRIETGGAIDGALAFDSLNIYAASANGLLSALTQRGTVSFPAAPLGAVALPFAPAPSVLGQTLAVSGLRGSTGGGRVRGINTNGLSTLWDRDFTAEVRSSPTQFLYAVTQVTQGSDGTDSETTIGVIDYLVVDQTGTGWLVDANLGTLGRRCIGGQDDAKSCRSDADCAPNAGSMTNGKCQPLHTCTGGTNAGILCRSDLAMDDCPSGTCTPITECKGGASDGTPCNDDVDCPEGTCDLSLFSVGAPVEASPIFTGEGTLVVATAPASGGGTVYLIDPPNQSAPLESTCTEFPFCRVAFKGVGLDLVGAVRASPSVNSAGTIYFGDDNGVLWAILNEPLV